jgi:hypothetical protein
VRFRAEAGRNPPEGGTGSAGASRTGGGRNGHVALGDALVAACKLARCSAREPRGDGGGSAAAAGSGPAGAGAVCRSLVKAARWASSMAAVRWLVGREKCSRAGRTALRAQHASTSAGGLPPGQMPVGVRRAALATAAASAAAAAASAAR